MKVGDLVREIGMGDAGIIVGPSPWHTRNFKVFWRVLFGGESFDICENDLEVINEAR